MGREADVPGGVPRAALLGDGRRPASPGRRCADLQRLLSLLRCNNVRVTAARETGHHTHGDGTAVDFVPAAGATQRD
jgi:hypothetical protein